ncbi:hypothetical protein VULLAG_LOCUS12582 [Vulpes lagopus]
MGARGGGGAKAAAAVPGGCCAACARGRGGEGARGPWARAPARRRGVCAALGSSPAAGGAVGRARGPGPGPGPPGDPESPSRPRRDPQPRPVRRPSLGTRNASGGCGGTGPRRCPPRPEVGRFLCPRPPPHLLARTRALPAVALHARWALLLARPLLSLCSPRAPTWLPVLPAGAPGGRPTPRAVPAPCGPQGRSSGLGRRARRPAGPGSSGPCRAPGTGFARPVAWALAARESSSARKPPSLQPPLHALLFLGAPSLR